MIVYSRHPEELAKTLLALVGKFGNIAYYPVNTRRTRVTPPTWKIFETNGKQEVFRGMIEAPEYRSFGFQSTPIVTTLLKSPVENFLSS